MDKEFIEEHPSSSNIVTLVPSTYNSGNVPRAPYTRYNSETENKYISKGKKLEFLQDLRILTRS